MPVMEAVCSPLQKRTFLASKQRAPCPGPFCHAAADSPAIEPGAPSDILECSSGAAFDGFP